MKLEGSNAIVPYEFLCEAEKALSQRLLIIPPDNEDGQEAVFLKFQLAMTQCYLALETGYRGEEK